MNTTTIPRDGDLLYPSRNFRPRRPIEQVWSPAELESDARRDLDETEQAAA